MSTRKTTLFYGALIAVSSLAVGMVIASRLDLTPASSAQSSFTLPPQNSAPITGPLDAQTFRNIEVLLEAAGASLDNVVSCLVHLTDLSQFPAFNAIYEQKFTGVKPVRTTVRADLVAGLVVEITVVARAS